MRGVYDRDDGRSLETSSKIRILVNRMNQETHEDLSESCKLEA